MSERILSRPWINSSTLVLLLRLIVGIVFLMHGSQKLLGAFGGPGISGTVGFMGKMGIPVPLAYAAIFAEFFGGLSLLAGFLTRLGAFGIAVNMVVAILLVHLKNGFFAPKGFEFPLTLFVGALGIFLFGPGKYSVDAAITRIASESHSDKNTRGKAA